MFAPQARASPRPPVSPALKAWSAAGVGGWRGNGQALHSAEVEDLRPRRRSEPLQTVLRATKPRC
jgi:hypothetical protein